MSKIFIIGLPRTGTTSISVALLDYFKVAHIGYTKRTFELADVISDCPCFCDYQQLDVQFPISKFIYLRRNLDAWLPSIVMLLNKLIPTFHNQTYVSPILKRCFEQTFKLIDTVTAPNYTDLKACYQEHENAVQDYFNGRDNLLSIDIADSNSMSQLLGFLNLPHTKNQVFPHLNMGRRLDHWKEIKHINKIHSNISGREGRKYFAFVGT
ncbi:MAG: sulfotransferase [Paraglaciecola sp.]|uniref:sulfotransferase n=1 Tax=Paraglaciecola sp. TaxID=1920173 RepID=UPI003298AC49